jgi:hypothetical protein
MRVVGLALLVCVAAMIAWLSLDDRPSHSAVMRAASHVRFLPDYIERYRDDHGHLPPAEAAFETLAGEYIMSVPVDPWRRPYVYRLIEEPPGYRIYSVGIDGVDEYGAGDDVIAGSKYYRCDTYGVNCPRHFVSDGLFAVSALALLVAAIRTTWLLAMAARSLAGRLLGAWRRH